MARAVVSNRNTAGIRYRQVLEQLFRVAFTGLVDQVAVQIQNRVRADFLRGRNIRTGHDHALDFRLRARAGRRWRWRVLRVNARSDNEWNSDGSCEGDADVSEGFKHVSDHWFLHGFG